MRYVYVQPEYRLTAVFPLPQGWKQRLVTRGGLQHQFRYTDDQGQTQNPTLADCAQAVSAVKAIAIAQSQGQKIYTINQSNAATALPNLTIGGDVGAEIRNAIQAGKEVTFHESQINAHGFTGYGYIITHPETGAGAYMIEGRGNGAMLFIAIALLSFAFPPLWFVMAVGVYSIATFASLAVLVAAMIYGVLSYIKTLDKILSQENLSQDEKDGVIKAISALVVFSNILGGIKGATEKGAAWAAAGLAILSTVLQQAVGYLVVAIDLLREAKK
ncbi:hypothetical protein KW843_17095 [Acidovorax sp. sif1233]|uniref:hypothetical protein n=1 Tax=Acidovorax sp. sif1233 TaxID=2854792 RepID=UPI001C4594DF|nr:hypothetical protein [Acidovorax sp. sif1233]MBV7456200.1 hypothetical protein [Acidovorax sp. sif1233]